MKKHLFVEGVLLTGQTTSLQAAKRQILEIDQESGLFVGVFDPQNPPPHFKQKADYVFSNDCVLLAAPMDVHVHAREDVSGEHLYKEDFVSASQAALNGGVHAVADMPNNPRPPLDDHSYLQKLALTKKALVPIVPYAAILPHSTPLSWDAPYKIYLGPSIGELNFPDLKSVDQKLREYRGKKVSFHCEDAGILEKNKTKKNHFARRPREAELISTQFALEMIEKHELQGKLCHFSASHGLKLVAEAKKKGVKVQIEVTPQHLFFCQEELENSAQENFFQMNPPIRGEEDRQALVQAVHQGQLDFLATDHAPHSPEEKKRGTSGLTGLDTYGPFLTHLLVTEKVSPSMVAKLCSENPALFLNPFLHTLKTKAPWFSSLGLGLGFFQAGFSASFSVLDLKTPMTVTTEILKTKAKSSPFLGHTFPGSVKMVFHQGKIV